MGLPAPTFATQKSLMVSVNGSSRGYFYGKLNSLVCFRPTYGGKLILFQAKRENGIEISYKWHLGPSFGLLKPVYLKIAKFNSNPIDEDTIQPYTMPKIFQVAPLGQKAWVNPK